MMLMRMRLAGTAKNGRGFGLAVPEMALTWRTWMVTRPFRIQARRRWSFCINRSWRGVGLRIPRSWGLVGAVGEDAAGESTQDEGIA